MRYLSIIAVVLLAAVLTGCEEGEAIDIDPGTPKELFLEVKSAIPGTPGEAVSVRATFTDGGDPVQGVDVTFSATNISQADRPAIPNPVSTSILGFADTNISTLRADTELIIKATAGGTTSNTVNLDLTNQVNLTLNLSP